MNKKVNLWPAGQILAQNKYFKLKFNHTAYIENCFVDFH